MRNMHDTSKRNPDLRALPAWRRRYQFLRKNWGIGEVSARIQSFGRSEIQETAYPVSVGKSLQPGRWHFNRNHWGQFLASATDKPRDDVAFGQVRLGKLLNEITEKSSFSNDFAVPDPITQPLKAKRPGNEPTYFGSYPRDIH